MTQLTIIPKVADKTAMFKGTIAAGEHVAVTIKGGAEWIGTDSGANLTLRVLDLVTGRTLAVFPRPEEVLEENEEADEWAVSEEDAGDLTCTLNLNTLRMVAAARHMLRVPVMFVLGDTDDPRTLYFRDRYEVEYWPERIGDTVPYDLDKWPKKIDEWTELVAGWTARLNGLKLEAERTEAVGTTPGKTKLTLNDGTAEEDTVVEILDGQVSADQLASAVSELEDEIDDKQDALTFDDAPTADSANPVKSGGVKNAIDTVATNLSTHTGNSGIHVTADQKSAWTAKYAKPSGGIPASDLAGEIGKAKLTSSVQGSLDKADTAVQPDALSAYVNDASYDSTENKILFKHGSTTIAYIDATAFIKDGMVSSVAISNGYLVITFNTDAGTSPISIALTDIFNPANYYDKTASDNRFVQKEAGKGLVAVDATLATSGAAADAKAVGDALAEKLNSVASYPAWDASRADYLDGEVVSWHGKLWKADEDILDQVGPPDGDGAAYWDETTLDALKQAALSSAQLAAVNSGVTSAKVATWDGYAAQIALKANLTDLPYRLVEPGKWEFSGVPSGWELTDINYSLGDWTISYVVGGETDSISTHGAEDALSLTFDNGDQVHITATRASLPGHLLDRAGNRVEVSGDTTLTLPAAVPGYLRDFIVRLEISGSTVPTITFAAPTGETLTYETDGDEFPVPDEAGDWLYSFTESCVAHKFAVSLKKVNEVAQGGS